MRYALHLTGEGHPERPERVLVILESLKRAGLLTKENLIVPRMVTDNELLLCHTEEYVKLVSDEVAITGSNLTYLSTGDVVVMNRSDEIARLAVGGVLEAVDAVMKGTYKSVFCVTRPPGHHACTSIGMGFCLYNNIAIGARYAQRAYGIKRVLIADWDVHHGNGTQQIFYEDGSVFYFSTHQYPLYPMTGAENEIGVGEGKGTTFNVPIARGAYSRVEVLRAFRELLPEAMEQFRPELVMISAGFDGHERDPLGGFNLTDNDFGELTLAVREIAEKYANGRIVSVLEGGYDLEALISSGKQHVKSLIKT